MRLFNFVSLAITAAAICRASGLQPLLRLAFTLDRRYGKLQKLSITVVRYLTQTSINVLKHRERLSNIFDGLCLLLINRKTSCARNNIDNCQRSVGRCFPYG